MPIVTHCRSQRILTLVSHPERDGLSQIEGVVHPHPPTAFFFRLRRRFSRVFVVLTPMAAAMGALHTTWDAQRSIGNNEVLTLPPHAYTSCFAPCLIFCFFWRCQQNVAGWSAVKYAMTPSIVRLVHNYEDAAKTWDTSSCLRIDDQLNNHSISFATSQLRCTTISNEHVLVHVVQHPDTSHAAHTQAATCIQPQSCNVSPPKRPLQISEVFFVRSTTWPHRRCFPVFQTRHERLVASLNLKVGAMKLF